MKSLATVGLLAVIAGCAHVTQSSLPSTPNALAYKEAKTADAARTKPLTQDHWWTVYEDEELERLQVLLLSNSPDLGSALARYQQASAATDSVRAARTPVVGASLDAQRNRQSEQRPLRGASSPDYYNSASLGLNLSYEIDLWGRISQQVAAGEALEKAAQADLAAARLSLQAQLTDTLIALRGADREIGLLRDTESAYGRAADMVGERHRAGIASGLDLARAQAQRETATSQLHQVQAQRAVLEHAIAALVGEHASTFALPPSEVPDVVPNIPFGLPSELLERRPDIVAAQQRVQAASASVGIARKAFFPSVRLSAAGGFQSDDFGNFIATPNIFWAIGPGLLATVFDGGRRKAEIERAQGVLDEAGHRYRGEVLGAFQQVEDQLALLARYREAAAAEGQAMNSTQRALELATNRYRDGAASYLEVVTSQTAHLQARRSALDLSTRQRRATVQLVRALGGGWSEINDASTVARSN